MDWLVWIIFLIPLAVWILGNFAKNQQDQRRPERPVGQPRPNPPAEAGPKPQRSAAEIEDFLQEVRRRREAAEQRKGKRTTVETPAPARPVPATPRPAEPVRSRPSLEAPIPMAVPTPPARPQATPQTPRRQNEGVPMPSVTPRQDVIVAQLAAPPPPALPVAPAPAFTRVRLGTGSGAPKQFLQLLRNPESMATAILLRELLDPPLSRRRRRPV